MVVKLSPDLEAVLNEQARQLGIAPEVLAVNALRERFIPSATLQPQDEWERRLLGGARNWGVSLPDSALRREELYD